MKFNIKEKFNDFINNNKDYPILTGFVVGFYPLIFFYSNNFETINSFQHLLFFCFLFFITPIVFIFVIYRFFNNSITYNHLKRHFLFVTVIEFTAVLFSMVYFLNLWIKVLLFVLFISILLSIKFNKQYKKVIVFIFLLSIIPLFKLLSIFSYRVFNDTLSWMNQKDCIKNVRFKKSPNIYFIEPDGYAGKEEMEKYPYEYKNNMYDWLESKNFTLYKNTNSNYPATLASNASMFGMKHHFLGKISNSPFEMDNARSIIVGNNPVISILKNNNYKNYFIVTDEYFQQSFKKVKYDFFNIKNAEIPYFTNSNNVQKDVYADLKIILDSKQNLNQPKFYFIEKMLPHHIHFDGTGKANERKVYLEKIEKSNVFLKKITTLISEKDPNGIIIIASDHGGWVGIENENEMFTIKQQRLIKSIFGNLLAIKWNNKSHFEYDEKLKSNVNIFRILFSYLSEDKLFLKNLEGDESYNIGFDSDFSKKAVKIIN